MDNCTEKKLAQRIKLERKRMGLTQAGLAQKLGTKSAGSINNWESGLRSPNSRTLYLLAELFGVSTDYLLGRDENRTPFQAEKTKSEAEADDFEEYSDIILKYESCDEIGQGAIINCIDYHYKRSLAALQNAFHNKYEVKRNQEINSFLCRKNNPFIGKDSPDYKEINSRIPELKSLKKRSAEDYRSITDFLWHAGYGDSICKADVMGIFEEKAYEKKVPSRELFEDIRAFLSGRFCVQYF